MGRAFDADDDEDDGDDGSAELMGSFADMMTLLLGFFMILYSMSHMDEKKFYEFGKTISSSFKQVEKDRKNQIYDKLAEQNRQIRAFQMMVAILNLGDEQSAVNKIEDVYTKKVTSKANSRILNSELLAGASKKLVQDGRNVLLNIVLPADDIFANDSVTLTNRARKRLRKLASSLTKVVGPIEIEVAGHTDAESRLPPGFKDRWEATSAQARSVANQLIEYGVQGKQLAVSGRAHFQPLFKNLRDKKKKVKSKAPDNRRVEITIFEKA